MNVEPPTMAEVTAALIEALRKCYGNKVANIKLIEMKVTLVDGITHSASWRISNG